MCAAFCLPVDPGISSLLELTLLEVTLVWTWCTDVFLMAWFEFFWVSIQKLNCWMTWKLNLIFPQSTFSMATMQIYILSATGWNSHHFACPCPHSLCSVCFGDTEYFCSVNTMYFLMFYVCFACTHICANTYVCLYIACLPGGHRSRKTVLALLEQEL